MKSDVEFLALKQAYINIPAWRNAFYTHVFSSIFVMLAGFTQFSAYILKQYPKLHRKCGYFYVINILIITGPASFLMSFYANGGISSRVAFVLLATLWMSSTSIAIFKAIKKDFTAHRIFMIRSFALTLSAISLRIWKIILLGLTDISSADRYRIIAWLGWTINILIAEWYIFNYIKKKSFLRTHTIKQQLHS